MKKEQFKFNSARMPQNWHLNQTTQMVVVLVAWFIPLLFLDNLFLQWIFQGKLNPHYHIGNMDTLIG